MAATFVGGPTWHLEQTENPFANATNETRSTIGLPVAMPDSAPANVTGGVLIHVTLNKEPVVSANNRSYDTATMLQTLYNWTVISNTFATLAEQDIYGFPPCDTPTCSGVQICRRFYHCLSEVWATSDKRYPENVGDSNGLLEDCLDLNITPELRCGIWIIDLFHFYHDPCTNTRYKLSSDNWGVWKTNENIQLFKSGGQDLEAISWLGVSDEESFSQALGSQLTNVGDSACSLERPCTAPLNCDQVGSWTSIQLGSRVLPSSWGYFALTAVQNINHHLSNQYLALKGALGLLALDGFTISHFFPTPNTGLKLSNALTGLGTILSIAGGFIPSVGDGLVAVGTFLPAIGSYLSNSIQEAGNTNVGQELYSTKVKEVYINYIETLNNMSTALLAGKPIAGGYDIFQMMADGRWANSSALPRLSSLETSLRLEILSRSINSLWKTRSSNKMWVLFVDLGDDKISKAKCLKDTSGPPDSKYCDDGGVYYTYNYIEVVAGEAYVGYPWGGLRLMPEHGINLSWVSEASAKTYRLAKQNGTVDPFNVSGQTGTDLFLRQFINNNRTQVAELDQAGRYPGSWTLPVCDAGIWGRKWNWDYNATSFSGDRKRYSHPPCLCGDEGSETDAWAVAAGMYDFDTFHVRCTQALESKDFEWPPGVTSVTFSSPRNYTVKKPGS